MSGIPPHRDPETEEEREIAAAMIFCRRLHEQIQERYGWLPESAISVGMINYGTQIGVETAAPTTVASYLIGIARIIAPLH